MMTVGSWMTVEVELSNANDLLADLTRIKHPNVNNKGVVQNKVVGGCKPERNDQRPISSWFELICHQG